MEYPFLFVGNGDMGAVTMDFMSRMTGNEWWLGIRMKSFWRSSETCVEANDSVDAATTVMEPWNHPRYIPRLLLLQCQPAIHSAWFEFKCKLALK
jgi:hypothetical protein